MAITTPLSTLPLPVVDQDGKILETRLKDVAGARSLWARLRDADLKSNIEMAKHQAMADGKEPFDQAERRRSGQAYLANFNPNDFKALLDTSLAAYTDLISADETLIEMYTTFGTKEERDEWSQIMSKNLSRAIRSWPQFLFQYAYISHYFTLHGVGVVYFEDCYNWQWEVSNLAMMKIPRDTCACEDKIPYAFVKSQVHPQDLIKYIQNEKFAEQEGWKIPALKKALMQAQPQMPDGYNWMEFEQRWKNNDIVWGENAPTIPVIYGWIKENDGSLSIYVFTEMSLDNPSGEPEEFLCVKRHAYKRVQEAFVVFTRGIGTNCTYHSIRGLGADIYNAMQALMRLENRKVDLAFACGPVFQVADEEKLETAMLTPWGPYMLATAGVTVLNTSPIALTATIDPAVNSLRNTIQQNVGQYTSANALQGQREMTAKETMARLEQTANLSVTSINLYNQPADRLAREIVRRFTRKGYQRSDPGGDYVHDWILDCIEEGVPMQAIHSINHRRTRASRTIGFGSAAARRVALQSLKEMYPEYDDEGKQKLIRDITASIVGWEKASEYAPPVPNQRPVIDTAIADLQNNELIRGGQCPIYPNENKHVHLTQHLGAMTQFIQQFNEAGQNPELYAQIVPPLDMLYEHAAQTMEGYTGMDAPQFNQALQNAGEILVNGTRHLQKEQARQAEEQQAQQMQAEQEGGMQQPQGPNPDQEKAQHDMTVRATELQYRILEWQLKLQNMAADNEAKIARELADAEAKRHIADLDAQARILRENASVQARAATASTI